MIQKRQPNTPRTASQASRFSDARFVFQMLAIFSLSFFTVWMAGCSQNRNAMTFDSCGPSGTPCADLLQKIEYPNLLEDQNGSGDELITGPPLTISNFQDAVPWELTLDQCVELALANSKIMQKLGGVIVNSPAAASTLYDQALQETGLASVERALSAFDAQVQGGFTYNRSERVFNNPFIGGGAAANITNSSNFNFGITKQTATGATFGLSNLTLYNRNSSPANSFGSVYDVVNSLNFRQPVALGKGTLINRIAGPNATPGQYNGVLISRIRSDVSLADFESAVRDLVRDVETNYWELYFAYRDLDTKLEAREASRETWENRKLRYENGVGRPDDEAQSRQQYYSFQAQAQNALTGVGGQGGVLGSERNLRRLMGLVSSDGKLIRPITEPAVAPIVFDWNQTQREALNRRVELRRQQWQIRQRELELVAAKQLNKWQFDLVGNYGWRGFGDNLFGSRDRINGSAVEDLTSGDLDDWQLGVEFGGAIGNRTGHLAIRNAELNLVRERAIFKEQQRQILHDLNAQFTEVDRALQAMKTNFNARVAAFDELEPKRKRVNEGQDQVFFLLDAQQRTATAESAVHRSVADYNLALLNFTYASGTLLSRYNIRLTEDAWSDSAQTRAIQKAGRMETTGEPCCVDSVAVSQGPFNQAAPRLDQYIGNTVQTDYSEVYATEELPQASEGTIKELDAAPPTPQSDSDDSDVDLLELPELELEFEPEDSE